VARVEHVAVSDFVQPECAAALLAVALRETNWTRHTRNLNDYFAAMWAERTFERPHGARPDSNLLALMELGRDLIEREFRCVLGRHFTVGCNRMVEGQLIRIHNDSPDGARGVWENYRQLLYLDKDYTDDCGGALCLFAGSDTSTITRAVRPVFNTCVAMQLSTTSYHAVSKIRRGERYSVVVSYWGYPLLVDDFASSSLVSKHLRFLVDAGLESEPYGSTSIANHAYHTYRLLRSWDADLSVSLAGLWRRARRLLDPQSEQVFRHTLSSGGVNDELQNVLGLCEKDKNELSHDQRASLCLIGLADALEEVTCESEARDVEVVLDRNRHSLAASIATKVAMEIDRVREQVCDPTHPRNRRRGV